ncbi:MAG TPA: hypothetical protein PLN85_00165 [archaeon]|nr:hypothetical protein [archaeon]
MKIIQTYYQIDKKTDTKNFNDSNIYLLNFYSLLLSYLTIKKLYGNVEIYSNKLAYDKILKYIPYDNNIIIDENNNINSYNYLNEWDFFKFNVYEKQKEPFIHIEGDVFIFKDLLSEYINNKTYDGIVQSIETSKSLFYNNFYFSNIDMLEKHDFIDKKKIEKSYEKYSQIISYNCGVVGFRNMEFFNEYLLNVKKMIDLINKGILKIKNQSNYIEQFTLYSLSQKLNKKIYEVLPESDILKYGYNQTGNMHGYTHLLGKNKYVGSFIVLIRNKIIKNFPKYKKNIEMFENSLNDFDFMTIKHKDENKFLKSFNNK